MDRESQDFLTNCSISRTLIRFQGISHLILYQGLPKFSKRVPLTYMAVLTVSFKYGRVHRLLSDVVDLILQFRTKAKFGIPLSLFKIECKKEVASFEALSNYLFALGIKPCVAEDLKHTTNGLNEQPDNFLRITQRPMRVTLTFTPHVQ